MIKLKLALVTVLTIMLLCPLLASGEEPRLLASSDDPLFFVYNQECVVTDDPIINPMCPTGMQCFEVPQNCPEVEVELIKGIGNLHAAGHPDRARKNGYASCMECHDPFNPTAVVDHDNVICTQYNPPDRFIGRRITNPATGADAVDPITGELLVGSNNLLVWYAGDTVVCNTCHYPHSKGQKYFEKEDKMIHEGCLDCHKRVGKDDKKKNRPQR